MSKPSIFDFTRERLAEELDAVGQPSFRAHQVFEWIYRHRTLDPSSMTNLPAGLRDQLIGTFDFALPSVSERLAASDRTVKYRVGLRDSRLVECVMMPDLEAPAGAGGVSMCISSQVGCALGCAFCATGTMGRIRDLTAGEIVAQVVLMLHELDYEPTTVNILYMGMGEPLLNLSNTLDSLIIFGDEKGLNVPMRRITVSTVGIPNGMRALFALERSPRLAVSLHAPDQPLRAKLMPISRKYTLEEVVRICRDLPLAARERVTLEYVLLKDVNDQPGQAKELAKLLHGMQAKVNLIPHNYWEGVPFREPDEETIDRFMRTLIKAGVTATVRRSRGRDAAAACGQLAVAAAGKVR